MSTDEETNKNLEPEKPKPGPPWNNVGIFQSYDAASELKVNLSEEKTDHQFKIKRLSTGFVVKSRLHPDLMPKKGVKKNGKNSKSRKRNSNKGKTEVA